MEGIPNEWFCPHIPWHNLVILCSEFFSEFIVQTRVTLFAKSIIQDTSTHFLISPEHLRCKDVQQHVTSSHDQHGQSFCLSPCPCDGHASIGHDHELHRHTLYNSRTQLQEARAQQYRHNKLCHLQHWLLSLFPAAHHGPSVPNRVIPAPSVPFLSEPLSWKSVLAFQLLLLPNPMNATLAQWQTLAMTSLYYLSVRNVQSFCQFGKVVVDVMILEATTISS